MSWGIWIIDGSGTGEPGTAAAAAARLRTLGQPVIFLDLDEVSRIVAPDRSRSAWEAAHRAFVQIASTCIGEGLPVIVDATAHRRAWREAARALIPRFAEVLLVAAEEPGWEEGSHEPPLAPELYLDAVAMTAGEVVDEIVALARRLGGDAPRRQGLGGHGHVIWIAGKPGTGKTTLARGVAVGLAADKVEVATLELAVFHRALAGPTGCLSPPTEEMAHRALVGAAKLLAGAGLTVLVDAATPRRAWRELARATLPMLVEVQLVCPLHVAIERECTERWAPVGRPVPSAPPEAYPDYEEPATADVIVDTQAVGRWRAVHQVVELARRLIRTSTGERT